MNPTRRRHRQALPTPPTDRVTIPAAMRAPAIPDNRVTITRDLLRYATDVHRADSHAGQLGYGCRTCKRYSLAITLAAATEEEESKRADAFELPTSAANAYADAMRPHVGGPAPIISACRGTTTDPAAASTAATTAPPATRTSPPSKPPEPACAPNPSASSARGPESPGLQRPRSRPPRPQTAGPTQRPGSTHPPPHRTVTAPMVSTFGPLDVHCTLCGAHPGQRCTWLHRDRSAPTSRERRHVHHARRARAATENDRAHRRTQP
jgi:hypothetical protein